MINAERYINKEDFDNLDNLNLYEIYEEEDFYGENIHSVITSVKKDELFTEKVIVYFSSGDDQLYFPHYCILKPNQNYGFANSSEIAGKRVTRISSRMTDYSNKKIYLPDIYLNMQDASVVFDVTSFLPSHDQYNLILDYNNRLNPNHKKGLKV